MLQFQSVLLTDNIILTDDQPLPAEHPYWHNIKMFHKDNYIGIVGDSMDVSEKHARVFDEQNNCCGVFRLAE